MKRVGIDIGGTFTDLVVYDEVTKEISRSKIPTTPRAPEEGFLRACQENGLDISSVSRFLHATTLVTNMIIQRAGPEVGLITTAGFRDVLEIGYATRAEIWNLQWERPKPFAPRHLVAEVDERIDRSGNIIRPIDSHQVSSVVKQLLDKGVQTIAVAFFNSYANDRHEKSVGDIIRAIAPEIRVSLSSEVDPRIREYPRTSTTVLNAYAMPRVYRYVETLDSALEFPNGLKYMHSGGGIIPSSVARKFPIMLVESGPAAGVLAGQFLGQKLGIKNIITGDVGGTSFDVCVIKDGAPEVKDTTEVEALIPLRSDSIDVISIGAGGGSIAWIDEGGALRVGPRSAGADPGPACYELGGTEPTVTDANVVLGILSPVNFLGGKLKVDPQRSRDAIRPIAERFGVSVPEAALGIYKIVNANMAQAIRQITVQKGIDPREFAFIPFGGAGAQHAVEVARELDITSVLFPKNASTLSAFGLLTADLKYIASKTWWKPLAELSSHKLAEDFEELEQKAINLLKDERASVLEISVDRSADVRYVGQWFEVRVPLERGPISKEDIQRSFDRVYLERYGVVLGDPLEIVNIHATAIGHIQSLELPKYEKERASGSPKPVRFARVAFYDRDIPVFNRDDLRYGMSIEGACIVEEVDTTIFVPEGCLSEVDEYGNIRTTILAKSRQEGPQKGDLDPFTAEIIRSYLMSTVKEMVKTTTGTAYSTCFAEGTDFTCAIFDAQGRMVAQALGLPLHAGALSDAMDSILRHFDSFSEADCIIMNDPFEGGSHQPDAVVVRPIFYGKRLIAFAFNRGHWTDIGGMAAGGWSGSARHVVQEALIIPAVKLYNGGILDRQIRDFLIKNVRLPKQLWGDVQSQIASNITAERRLTSLIEKYGIDVVLKGMQNALDYSRTRFRRMLQEIPDGTGSAHDFVDNDGFTDKLYRVNVAVEKTGGKIIVDCGGTDRQAAGPINCSRAAGKAGIYASLFALVDPQFSMTQGALDLIELRIPEGTVISAVYPAPVAGYYGVVPRLFESVIRAFSTICPERITTGSHGDSQNITGWGFAPETAEEFIWYSWSPGGCGARATKDGELGYHLGAGGAKLESMEAWERRYPVFFERFELITDSGGAGKHRGGLGFRRDIRLLTETFLNANCDRQLIPPWGIFGGKSGAPNRIALVREGVRRGFREMFGLSSGGRFSNIAVKKDDILVIEMGGGGGYGDPLERDPKMVESDVFSGYVSVGKARDDFGVCLDPRNGKVSYEKTRDLRERLLGDSTKSGRADGHATESDSSTKGRRHGGARGELDYSDKSR